MAARDANHAISDPQNPDPELPTLEADLDQPSMSSAVLNQRLSMRRKSAANFKRLTEPSPTQYRRVTIAEQDTSEEDSTITSKLRSAISLRNKWLNRRRTPEWVSYPPPRHSDYTVFVPPPYHPFDQSLPPASEHVCQWHDGIVQVFSDRKSVMRRQAQFSTPTLEGFAQDLAHLMNLINDPDCRSFCYRRLLLLQERFNMYIVLNEDQERLSQIRAPHRDFYNVRKVDVHGKSSMLPLDTPVAASICTLPHTLEHGSALLCLGLFRLLPSRLYSHTLVLPVHSLLWQFIILQWQTKNIYCAS